MMNILKYDRLLFDAIDLLLVDMDQKEICEELGISEEEFDTIGQQFDDVCQYAIDVVSRHDEDFETIIPKLLEDAGYEVMGCTWKATWTRKGYSKGEPPISCDYD